MIPINDSIAMFSNGEDIEPIDGRILCSCMVLDGSSDTHLAISWWYKVSIPQHPSWPLRVRLCRGVNEKG